MSPASAVQPLRRVEVHLSTACPQACVFCAETETMERVKGREPSAAAVGELLLQKRVEGFEELELTGGEPTTHSGFVAVLAAGKRLGYRTVVSTSGQRLSEPAFASQALPYVDELRVSVHGDTAALHDVLSGRPGSFDAALQALALGAERDGRLRLSTNTVVTSRNVERVLPILELLLSLPGVRHCTLTNVAPEGRASFVYETLTVPLARWPQLAEQACELADSTDATLRIAGVPLCALGSHLALSSDLYAGESARLELDASGKVIEVKPKVWPVKRRGRPRVCARCSAKALCAGVYERSLLDGPKDLAPLRDVRLV